MSYNVFVIDVLSCGQAILYNSSRADMEATDSQESQQSRSHLLPSGLEVLGPVVPPCLVFPSEQYPSVLITDAKSSNAVTIRWDTHYFCRYECNLLFLKLTKLHTIEDKIEDKHRIGSVVYENNLKLCEEFYYCKIFTFMSDVGTCTSCIGPKSSTERRMVFTLNHVVFDCAVLQNVSATQENMFFLIKVKEND